MWYGQDPVIAGAERFPAPRTEGEKPGIIVTGSVHRIPLVAV
jgi:hypothetical protein